MSKHSRFYYGWIILIVGILTMSLAYGVRYSFSVIFSSLLEQFHWSRDATAAILSFHIITYGVSAPIAGILVDRIGPRKTMSIGAILLASGAAASSFGNVLWHYYVSFGFIGGMGLGFIGTVPFIRVITNWFVNKRGLALSLFFFGAGGQHIIYPLIAVMIEKLGLRGTFLAESIIVIGFLLPCIIIFIRYHPREMGLSPDSNMKNETSSQMSQSLENDVLDKAWVATDWTLTKAIKTYRFWLLCFCAFSVWGITEHLLLAHHIAFAEDVGYSKLYASSVLTLFGVMMSIGAIGGSISDRIGREVAFSISTVLGVSGIVIISQITDMSQSWMLYAYSICFGLGIGMSIPVLAASVTDLFQGKNAGGAIGFVWFAFAIGGGIGPWLGGALFEISGSYTIAFTISAIMFIAGCISVWLAAPRQVRIVAGRVKTL
jgi:sugar phosphate permease